MKSEVTISNSTFQLLSQIPSGNKVRPTNLNVVQGAEGDL